MSRMMKANCLVAVFTVLLALTVSGGVAAAQEKVSYDVRLQSAEIAVHSYVIPITQWERQATITLVIAILLAVLGGFTAFLGAVTRPWTKTATVAAGALVTSLTVISGTVLDGDYKTLHGRAVEGRVLLLSADGWIQLAHKVTADQDREQTLKLVGEKVGDLARLMASGQPQSGPSVATAEPKPTSSLFPSTVVFAAMPAGCGCAGMQKSDEGTYKYFCGEATGTSLTEARGRATADALAKATGSLRTPSASQSGAGPSFEALENYVRGISTEADSCAVQHASGFLFSVLLRVPSTLTSTNAQKAFAAPVNAGRRVRLTLDRIQVIEDGSARTTGWKFEVKAGGKTLMTLPNRNYDNRVPSNVVSLGPASQAIADIDLQPGQPLRIDVNGQRSFVASRDKATGSGMLNVAGAPLSIEVKNPQDARDGSFVFFFSAN